MLGAVSLPPEARDIRGAIAAARGLRNVLTRRRREEARASGKDERDRQRHRRKAERELERFLRWRVRIQVRPEDRATISRRAWRDLYHRASDGIAGGIGRTDSRGRDGLYPIHFAFTPRGFKTLSGRAWRNGEAMRAGLYITRDKALEDGEQGWWANCADDRDELVAFLRLLEEFEREDRSNANVYVSEIIALPAELTARQRRAAVKRICRFFVRRGLAYVVGMHVPDPGGDQRNFHCHIVYSLRPVERVGPYDWSFSLEKHSEISTPAGIAARRRAVVEAINETLAEAGIEKRYTHLSNAARGLRRPEAKVGQAQTWLNRRIATLEQTEAVLSRAAEMADRLAESLVGGAALAPLAGRAREALERTRDTLSGTGRAPKGRVKGRLVEVNEHLEAVIRADPLSSLTSRVDSAAERRGLLEAALDRITAIVSLPPDLERLASDVQGRLVERRGGLPRDGAVLPKLAVRVGLAWRREEGRKKVAEQVAAIESITQASVQFSETSSNLNRRLKIALAGARTRLATTIDTGRGTLAALGVHVETGEKRIGLRDRRDSLAANVGSIGTAESGLAHLRERVAAGLRSKKDRLGRALHQTPIIAGETAGPAPLDLPSLEALQCRVEGTMLSLGRESAPMENRGEPRPIKPADEQARSRTPALQAVEPRRAAADPEREAAIKAYADHIRTSKEIILLRVGDREVVDGASVPEEWRRCAIAFDEEAEVMSAISEVAARKKERERSEAYWTKWRAKTREEIIAWARSQSELPVYPDKGRWRLQTHRIEDEDLRYYARAWWEDVDLQKAYAQIGERWVRARPHMFDLAGIARDFPGTPLAAAIGSYLARRKAGAAGPATRAQAAVAGGEAAPPPKATETSSDATLPESDNPVFQAWADKKKKTR